MSDKMMTPEDYLIENPTHILAENELDGHTYAEYVKNKKRVGSDFLQIDWTGYTEPHVMIGPDFPQSRKLEVKWGIWRITPDKVNKGDVPFQRVELPDGGTCFRIGQYIDEPVKPETELSRFLPDGWAWADGKPIHRGAELDLSKCRKHHWNNLGLLHPSEGGGFQKHTPGDPMPCDGDLSVDVLWDNHQSMTTLRYAKSGYWEDLSSSDNINGWRPRYKEQN
jgi:hypothetical protein